MKKILLVWVMLCVATLMAWAQVTTASLSGKVVDVDGEVIGATILAVHTPSGTTYGTITNANGNYSIRGMRVGGPYEVKISFIGYSTKVFRDISLTLGETYTLNTTLQENSEVMDEVVVTAHATKFHSMNTGAATGISADRIMSLPTVSRSVEDLTRLSPYGGSGMSFGGVDGRTANFTVDGSNFNNNFGLNEQLPGGGNPISLESLEEIQVVVSPFDVRQTNFVGGGVNAITKSGTNTFTGSAYVYHRNSNTRGDAVDGDQIPGARDRDTKTTYGLTLGGPLVKDRLFFFVNGEYELTPTTVVPWRASEDGVGRTSEYRSYASAADMDMVSEYVLQRYGYHTGSHTSFPADQSNRKLFARLDWNISKNHTLALHYNYTKNISWEAPNATSMDGGSRSPYARTSLYSMSFANSMYSIENSVHSFSLDFNSRFSSRVSNQLLATFSKLDDLRHSDSDEFPFIDILDGSGTESPVAYMSLGYELFTHKNAVHNTNFSLKDDATFYLGNHKVMAGISYDYQMADNTYMRNGTGYYRYASLSDFMDGRTPEIVCLTYGYNGETSPAYRVQMHKYGFYAQDEWDVNDRLMLTYGLRIDGLQFDDGDLMTNDAILGIDYRGRSLDTGRWPSATFTFSPRLGFNYDILGDGKLVVRGGTGLFSGRLPLVFLTNMPANSGMVQYSAQVNAKNAQARGFSMDTFAGGLVTDANGHATIAALRDKLLSLGYPANITSETGALPNTIAGVSPDFKMPQVWKSSVAIDYVVPVAFPLTLTAEGIFNKTLTAAVIDDWSLLPIEGFPRWNGVDNRPIYPTDAHEGVKAFVLENTSRGYGWTASFSANAKPCAWLDLMAAYTHTDAREVSGLPGSDASSVLNYLPTMAGPTFPTLHRAAILVPDRVVASATMSDKSGNHYSFVYEGFRGGTRGYNQNQNFTFQMVNDMNGDGYNYDVIYVPTDEEVASRAFRFETDDDRDRFMAFVHADDYLSGRQGHYAEAYAVHAPWVNRLDFSYKHDFRLDGQRGHHKLQLCLDVKNVLNLFSSSLGVAKQINPEIAEGRILKYVRTDDEGYPVFSTPKAVNGSLKTFTPIHAVDQCWYASFGVRYTFN